MPERTVAQMLSGKSENNLFPEYEATDTGDSRRTAIDDTSFSPEVKAGARWHIRSDNLLSILDAMIGAPAAAVDPGIEEAERLCNEASRDFWHPYASHWRRCSMGWIRMGMAVQRVKERLPPLTPAAADAVCDLTDTEISAVRALNRSPPQVVRVVVCVCCSLIKLARPGIVPAETSPQPLASWDDARSARPAGLCKGSQRIRPESPASSPADGQEPPFATRKISAAVAAAAAALLPRGSGYERARVRRQRRVESWSIR